MSNYVYNRIVCDLSALRTWLLDDDPFGKGPEKIPKISFNKLFDVRTVDEYCEKVGVAISYGFGTEWTHLQDDRVEVKFVTRWCYPIEAIVKLISLSHETLWYAIEENCCCESCFYWDGDVREKVRDINDGAHEWYEEHENKDPDYWDRFEEPDNYIWEYCSQAKEPWVEWPSTDGFQRYQQKSQYFSQHKNRERYHDCRYINRSGYTDYIVKKEKRQTKLFSANRQILRLYRQTACDDSRQGSRRRRKAPCPGTGIQEQEAPRPEYNRRRTDRSF